MERETTTLTVGTHTFKVKTYATAKEKNAIQQAYFTGAKVTVEGNEPKIEEFNPNVQYEVKKALIANLITEMNESTVDILSRAEDLPHAQFDELVLKLDEVAAKKN